MTATAAWLIAAVLVQGAVALVMLALLGNVRLPLIAAGRVHIADIALSHEAWPDRAKQVSNAFDNQFQLPVLFYVAVGVALYFQPSLLEVALVWLFVVFRIAHAAIFVTNNHVVRRFTVFAIGYGVLVLFWVDLVVRLILSLHTAV